MERVSMIILNWNKKDLLAKCLNTLKAKTDYDNYRVVVVDNGSQDSSAEMVRKKFSWVELIENKENLGWSKGNNVGIKYVLENHDPEMILVINNDIEVIEKDWLKKLVTVCSKTNVGITGCKLLYPDGKIQNAGTRIDFRGMKNYKSEVFKEDVYVDAVYGACLLIKREVIEKIGLFDEFFSPFLLDETDYCFRAREIGYKIAYTPKVALIHHESVSLNSVESDYVFYIRHRNRVRFMLIYYPIRWLIMAIPFEFRNFMEVFLESRDVSQISTKPVSLSNLRITKKPLDRFKYFLEAYLANLKEMSVIIYKRKNRIEKIWY